MHSECEKQHPMVLGRIKGESELSISIHFFV